MSAETGRWRRAGAEDPGVLVVHADRRVVRCSVLGRESSAVPLARGDALHSAEPGALCACCAELARGVLREVPFRSVVFVWGVAGGIGSPGDRLAKTTADFPSGTDVRFLDELEAIAHAFAHTAQRTFVIRFGEVLAEGVFVSMDGTIRSLSSGGNGGRTNQSHVGDYSEEALRRFFEHRLTRAGGTQDSWLAAKARSGSTPVGYETLFEAIEFHEDPLAVRILEEFLKPLANHVRHVGHALGIDHVVVSGDWLVEHLGYLCDGLRRLNGPADPCGYTPIQLERAVTVGATDFGRRNRTGTGVAVGRVGPDAVLRLAAERRIEYSVYQARASAFAEESGLLPEIVGTRPVLAVVDHNVHRLHGERIRRYLEVRTRLAGYVPLTVTERSKTLETAETICARAQELSFRRDGVFLGIGGGVLLDVVGFAASVFRRGSSYVRVPTTLVGLVDVGVGIKQGVNFGGSKNLLGAFYPPLATVNDRTFLPTLDEREIRCGLAEIVKMAVIRNEALFARLERHGRELLESRFTEPAAVAEEVITVSSRDMMEELQPNLFEEDLARLVDFGHSFSPTIELASDYTIAHGEAVAMDILLSCYLAVDRREMSAEDLGRVIRLYREIGLPTWSERCPGEADLYDGLADIKSHRGGSLNLVVPKSIGRGVFLLDVKYREIAMAVSIAREVLACSPEVMGPGAAA